MAHRHILSGQELKSLENEIDELKKKLHAKEQLLKEHQAQNVNSPHSTFLTTNEIVRYSRQMIIPDINPNGQYLLKNSKVLIIGAGGLGCPAALYLVSCGVGEITLVDYDSVELSNLHRQVLHYESAVGVSKVISAFNTLKNINSNIRINPLNMQVNSRNIEDIFKNHKFDVVLDCSDNVATRFLMNDVCVMNKTPLVSGSALQMEGHLTVYNFKGGPCYRCLFPDPPPSETVMNCGDAGVLGVVPGVVGILQALEAIKIITGSGETLSEKFLIFDATDTSFRRIKLRQKNSNCRVCGDNPSITSLIDYEEFCGSKIGDKVEDISVLNETEHVDQEEFVKSKHECLVLDVRPELEFQMCSLPGTVNFPFSKIQKQEAINELKTILCKHVSQENQKVFVLCRRGNDSQRAVLCLKEQFPEIPMHFLNVRGGLYAYARKVDSKFPVY